MSNTILKNLESKRNTSFCDSTVAIPSFQPAAQEAKKKFSNTKFFIIFYFFLFMM